MRKQKVCMFFNDLALYRKAIYKKLDDVYDCDWYIEEIDTGVKEFNVSELKKVTRLSIHNFGVFYIVKGLSNLLKKDYDTYFMLGATRNLSLMLFCLKKKLFYPRKRIYFWTHGYYGKENWLEKTFWKRPLLKAADGLFTYGDYAKRLMVEDGFDREKIFPIHNSLDYDTQLLLRNTVKRSNIYSEHFCNNSPVIIFIGRLTKIKKLDLLIDAISLLNQKGEKFNVVMVGDGSERAMLENRVTEKELNNQVWFYGACYNEKENAELVFNADLCVAPGNIGLTAMHVLMFGCPAISHNNFSLQMPEFEAIRPGQTGDYFEYGSPDNLAIKISKWFELNAERREEVREACYQEIDSNWNPRFQMEVIKAHLQ